MNRKKLFTAALYLVCIIVFSKLAFELFYQEISNVSKWLGITALALLVIACAYRLFWVLKRNN